MNQYLTTKSIIGLVEGYQINEPFEFRVFDDFIYTNKADAILEKVNQLNPNQATSFFIGGTEDHNKIAFTQNLGSELDDIFTYFTSDEFVDLLEKCTGIKGLIRNDNTLLGAGVHRIYNHGFLNVHTDFNSYYHDRYGYLDRRINLILYLNQDWKDEYNGELLLCDKTNKTIDYKIKPLFNRCVIFNTSNKSLHGHPTPLNCGDNIQRQSLAVYYYTKRVGTTDFEGDTEHSTIWYDVNEYCTKNMKCL